MWIARRFPKFPFTWRKKRSLHIDAFIVFSMFSGLTILALVDHFWIVSFNSHVFNWMEDFLPYNITERKKVIGVFMAITGPLGLLSYILKQKKEQGYTNLELYQYVREKNLAFMGFSLLLALVIIKAVS